MHAESAWVAVPGRVVYHHRASVYSVPLLVVTMATSQLNPEALARHTALFPANALSTVQHYLATLLPPSPSIHEDSDSVVSRISSKSSRVSAMQRRDGSSLAGRPKKGPVAVRSDNVPVPAGHVVEQLHGSPLLKPRRPVNPFALAPTACPRSGVVAGPSHGLPKQDDPMPIASTSKPRKKVKKENRAPPRSDVAPIGPAPALRTDAEQAARSLSHHHSATLH